MAFFECTGGCHCGNIVFAASLSVDPATFGPRACDCDFCLMHAAAYVSDPAGKLAITIRDADRVSEYRQGSRQAQFLVCSICGVLVAVRHEEDGLVHAAINARSVDKATRFAEEKNVSPKLLGDTEKSLRWKGAWFRDVSIIIAVSGLPKQA